jgi:tetratricopeptide (TPR) repeat protein
MARAFAKPSFARTFALTIVAIGALFAIDLLLAKTEREANKAEAERYFQNGRRLIEAGKSVEAVDQFQSALSLERENEDYQLALAQALNAAGKLEDAESTLDGLLERNSFAGPANLAMARVLAMEGRIDRAISYYHRAIYGQWKEGARTNPVEARLELVELLSRGNSKADLLAELLPLQDQAPEDPGTRMKLGNWFLTAGSPARAADVFREVLRQRPQEADAHAGLGEAEFAEANYRLARSEFLAAVRLRPDDAGVKGRLEVCDRVLALDPLRNGLSAEEENQRSRNLVELALEGLKTCAGSATSAPAPELIETAEKELKRPSATPDNIELAEQLWQMRRTACGPEAGDSDEALTLVMAKLAQ